MQPIETQTWRQELPAFKEKTDAFYRGELDKMAYKGFSGFYGSYAQRGGKANMLRLRMTAGRVTKEKLAFTANVVRKYDIKRIHFTTCQTIQLHDLLPETVYAVMDAALNAGIVTIGGGGDYPRNAMCSPLSGVEKGEYFDVLPYAEAASEYLMHFIKAEKMPRKLKVGFSNSPQNLTHATYRDLGFAARQDGLFDVYSAGGLGNNPRFGVKVAEGVKPEDILFHIKAMRLTFLAHGNYENRGKARTRYMQDALGGPENYKKSYLEKLSEVMASGEDLTLSMRKDGSLGAGKESRSESCREIREIPGTRYASRKGDGSGAAGPHILEQKQPGLYAVVWHPIGGMPDPHTLCALSDFLRDIPEAEVRLSPDETAYIINLTGREANEAAKLTSDGAQTLFETSVSCIGAGICQVGVQDSQALLGECVRAVREAGIPDRALPQIHISGCPSSCGTHQTGAIGFRGGVKMVDKKPQPAFVLYVNGNDFQGKETMGHELGAMLADEIPDFLTALGRTVAASGMEFSAWNAANPGALERLAADYLKA